MRVFGESEGRQAFSLVEMVIIIAVIAVLATIGVFTLNDGAISGAREEKLRNDLRVLNSAVNAYQAFGGNLDGVVDPVVVLAKLKTTVSEEQRRLMPGLAGSFIDSNVEFVLQSEKEAGSANLRMLWNATSKRFVLSEGGGIGIKNLKINRFAKTDKASERVVAGTGAVVSDGEKGQSFDNGTNEERVAALNYSKESSWIWDYSEGASGAPPAPSQIPTATPVPEAPPASQPVPIQKTTLSPPTFSIPSGNYPAFVYPLEIRLTDTNPVGAGYLVYSVDFGPWQNYNPSTQIAAPPDSTIQAQALPNNAEKWDPSTISEETYTSYYSKLLPPIIDFSEEHFTTGGSAPIDSISVSLTNPNSPSISEIVYKIVPSPGGDGPSTTFQTYSGSFTVSASDYPGGFGVRAYAASTALGYEDSRIVSKFATDVKGLFGGHLDLDTSTSISNINGGDTDAHTHDISGKLGANSINFFSIGENSQIEITEAINDPSQRFKLTVVNGSLSPGLSLILNYEQGGVTHRIDIPVDQYDDVSIENLTTFSLGGIAGTARLNGLSLTMSQDVIYQAGVVPTNTGEVRSNILGKNYEWRNGSLTVQAVAVDSSGNDAFDLDGTLSNGDQGAASSGLLWEAALFWHWDGASYSENGNAFEAGNLNSIIDEIDDPGEDYLAALGYSSGRGGDVGSGDDDDDDDDD